MSYRLLGAALALALLTYIPIGGGSAEAMQSRGTNNALATCVLSLITIGLPLGCTKARLASQTKGKAHVTIHRGPLYTCPNGNTYKIMQVSDPHHVCKHAVKRGHSVPECVMPSGKNGSAHSLIVLGRNDRWKAHAIHHACDVDWNH